MHGYRRFCSIQRLRYRQVLHVTFGLMRIAFLPDCFSRYSQI
nr:MAG TPA: hypothetical protein [Caudoviricetes sp.]